MNVDPCMYVYTRDTKYGKVKIHLDKLKLKVHVSTYILHVFIYTHEAPNMAK